MKVRMTSVISKEDGRTLGYKIERSVFPFGWRRVHDVYGGLASRESVEHYVVMAMRCCGNVKESMEFV